MRARMNVCAHTISIEGNFDEQRHGFRTTDYYKYFFFYISTKKTRCLLYIYINIYICMDYKESVERV